MAAQCLEGGGHKIFGVQLNDRHTRLAAEDGLMFGSVHMSMALEVMYQLRKVGYEGHYYFDTFPQRMDRVKEAERNIKIATKLWLAVGRLLGLDDGDSVSSIKNDNDNDKGGKEHRKTMKERCLNIIEQHDSVGALEMVDDELGL